MKLLLDEMYPTALGHALAARGMEAFTAKQLGVAGSSDSDLLEFAVRNDHVLLTENVSDFSRLAGERLTAGGHNPGILIALSSRLSRRPAGIRILAAAVQGVGGDDLTDRLVFLEQPEGAKP